MYTHSSTMSDCDMESYIFILDIHKDLEKIRFEVNNDVTGEMGTTVIHAHIV